MTPRRCLAACLSAIVPLCLLVGCPAIAQEGNARISGIVTDPGKAVIVGANVVAVSVETSLRFPAKTNGSGIYVLTALPVGDYRIEVEHIGFKSIVAPGVVLHTQDALEMNFEMAVGSASETVTVDGATTNDSPAVSLTVTHEFVENMPLNGRSFQDLISLAPGSVSSNGLYSFNGQNVDANYFTVDGVAANSLANPFGNSGPAAAGALPAQTTLGTTQSLLSADALEEFKIQTTSYSAEYGRQPGAQIELTSRSGTNDFHGTAFDYFRNTALDANNWFSNHASIPRQAEHQNDFGGTFGGFLLLPHIYNGKGRTFYFANYEGLRLQTPAFGEETVPTVAFRQFASPQVQPFLDSFPLPNGSENGDMCAASVGPSYKFSCTAQWSGGYSIPQSINSQSFRLDESVNSRIQFFARYSSTSSGIDSTQAGTPNDQSATSGNHVWTAGSTATLSTKLVDQLRFNYSYSSGFQQGGPVSYEGEQPYPVTDIIPSQFLPSSGGYQANFETFLPNQDQLTFPSLFRFGTTQRQFNLLDSVAWDRHNHQMKFGIDYRKLLPTYNPYQYEATIGIATPTCIQNGCAEFSYAGAFQEARPVFNNLSLYIQDDMRVTTRLTLNYGLRWEYNPAPGAANGVYPVTLTSSNLAVAQIAGTNRPIYKTRYDKFAPRFGFAYSPISSRLHSLVVRGAFGIFYDTGQALGSQAYSGYPFSNVGTVNYPTPYPLPLQASLLTPPSPTAPLTPPYGTLSGLSDPNLTLPYYEKWSLSIDQALNSKNTLTVSYVGSNGRKLLFTGYNLIENINPLFTDAYFTNNAGSSTYHGLQVQDHGYVAPGLELIASYTYAHAIDDASTDGIYFVPLRGNSDFDLRQALNVAANYNIPGARSGRMRPLTGGWSFDARVTAISGYPLDVYEVSQAILPSGDVAIVRPNLVSGVPVYLHNVPDALGGWELNPAAFSAVTGTNPTTGYPLSGDVGRNEFHGPNFWNINLAFQRTFAIYERLHLQFRTDAFNVLNHPNPGMIETYTSAATFGQSTGIATVGAPTGIYGTGAARSLQLMLKVQF